MSWEANARLARLYRAWSKGGAELLITGHVMAGWGYLERPGNVVATDTSTVEATHRNERP